MHERSAGLKCINVFQCYIIQSVPTTPVIPRMITRRMSRRAVNPVTMPAMLQNVDLRP